MMLTLLIHRHVPKRTPDAVVILRLYHVMHAITSIWYKTMEKLGMRYSKETPKLKFKGM